MLTLTARLTKNSQRTQGVEYRNYSPGELCEKLGTLSGEKEILRHKYYALPVIYQSRIKSLQ